MEKQSKEMHIKANEAINKYNVQAVMTLCFIHS